jgi:phospholipase C
MVEDFMRLTRRRALKGFSASAAAMTLPRFGAGCVDAAPTPSELEVIKSKVDTIVVVMMENRSFDHSFGALSLVEGRADIDGLVPGIHNLTSSGGVITPQAADVGCIADPPHGWDSSHRQFNNGACDGFVTEYERTEGRDAPHRCMDYLPRTLQPASFALGEQFAICQRWFASVMGPTWPNRFYLLAASSHGVQGNTFIGRPVDSLYTRLYDADIPWGNSYGNIPFGLTLEDMSIEYPEFNKYEGFFDRAAAGRLRPVEIVDPIYGRSDDHPPAHPLAGQIFLQSIYEALRTSPQWERSLLVVTYDEHGGFHDHVAPPKVEDDHADEGFDQLGFRVPAWVVGPFVKNEVSSLQLDHTSVYATIAAVHGLAPIGARDRAANTLLPLLDVDRMRDDRPRAGPQLPPIVADEAEIFADECKGFGLHGAVDVVGAITGQPELELAFMARFPNQAKSLRADTIGSMKDLLAQAASQGVWRRG